MSQVLQANIHTESGKKIAKKIRSEKKVPAIIYGGKNTPLQISLDKSELIKYYQKGGLFSRIVEIDTGKGVERVLPKDIQLHPITGFPLHADFVRVEKGETINVFVPIEFINADKSSGIKRGGVLNIVRREIEINVSSDNIPDKLTADLTGLKIGESVHIGAVTMPEGVKSVIERNFTLATIVGRVAKESLEGAVEAPEEGEGEDASSGEEKKEE